MWQRLFERAFLDYRAQGCSEDVAIALAERDAAFGLDQYCDDKFEEQRTQ
jgi:hypothetical protein